ncbi:CobW/HypB/UreG, nucleotide-binding domain-containing protein [Dunaliella salina]|uniref:CobW/HypB/UreG, nucleotide-binding domain-containing protein n=1 Tax=Dunaliella salina TaxID=3046 RepID=A0ABQ7FXI1_DUNSA|nr:CobW/HypB/UreG, nucleotide-binding domain-containing protein [Dunaliella salina]|eukprot:KAF5827062.1 CobW/HypB/UreG, nucleotide-binding domain-containing protein [Dunaliella salina]
MNNGCVCCTVRGDLIRIMKKLLKRKNSLDGIIVETTGLANPGPVIQTFFVDEEIKEACALDAVLTVVDARHVMQHLDEVKPAGVVNEAVQQIAFADKVLLNKTDLIQSEEEKAAVRSRIHNINAAAEIIECQYSNVDLASLLGISAFSLDRWLEKDPEFLREEEEAHKHDHGHDHHHHHHEHKAHGEDGHKCDDSCTHGHTHGHKHDDRVTSVGIQMEGECNMQKLNEWLSTLLQVRGPDLFRSKGILALQGTDHKHVFQGVHMILQFSSSKDGAGRPWASGEKRTNKLVFIGKNLDRNELTNSFKACLV